VSIEFRRSRLSGWSVGSVTNMSIRFPACFVALIAISAGVGSLGASRSSIGPVIQAVTPVPDVFKPFYEGFIAIERDAAVRKALPFERVSLERSGGMYVPAGSFRLALSKTGEATLWSDEGGTFGRSGEFVGTVDIFDFGKLSHLISSASFEGLAPRYARNFTDQQTLTVAVSTDRNTTAIADYGGAGPVQLWSIEEAIIAIGHGIAWKRK
jgi:hypothetical protein